MQNLSLPYLSLSIWLPIIAGIVLWVFGRAWSVKNIRYFAFTAASLAFIVTWPILNHFDPSSHAMQFVEQFDWITRFNIQYYLGIDGISLWFIPLTAFITWITVIAGWHIDQQKLAQYMGAFLVLSGLMIGVFCALDAILFYVFFEATLIPMFLIIGIWGGPRRVYAAFKFFLYTLMGSLLMLVALIYLYFSAGESFQILAWQQLPLAFSAQILLFIGFFFAFAVKVPMWPVHTWLPDAHVEAPTGGSVVLAAIMLKLGAYGFLRFSWPILPDATLVLAPVIAALSLIAIIYIGLVALVQADMKKLIAYSSVAHMGFVTLGFALMTPLGVAGGLVQMISHGFISAAMFLSIGVMYERIHSRQIADYSGLVQVMPRFAALFVLFSMANCGLPATSGFVGEWMVILAAVKNHFWIGFLAATSLVLGAAYSLWLVKRIMFGEIVQQSIQELKDLSSREWFILSLLAVFVIAIGVYPAFITDPMQASVQELLKQMSLSKLH